LQPSTNFEYVALKNRLAWHATYSSNLYIYIITYLIDFNRFVCSKGCFIEQGVLATIAPITHKELNVERLAVHFLSTKYSRLFFKIF
jgi:hypothetical protein